MINWAQHNAGTKDPLLMTHAQVTHLEGKWINQLREDLRTINGKLYICDVWTLPPTRENDQHIMDFISQVIHSTTHKRKINYCRLFLRITHISDITTSDGKSLHPAILQHPANFQNQNKHLNWPEQRKPDTTTWELWKKTLKTHLCYNNNTLKTPLGKWTLPYKKWQAYLNAQENTVVIYTVEWTKHTIIQETRTHMVIKKKGEKTYPPRTKEKYMWPITDLIPTGSNYQFTRPTPYKRTQKKQKPDTFQDYIKTISKWERQLFLYWEHVKHPDDLKMQILLGTALYYVTDGGADDGIGYFGWVIASDTRIITKGYGQAQGNEHHMESLRAETYGGIALFTFLKHYRIYNEISQPPNLQRYYCDNSTLIKRLKEDQKGKPYPSQYIQADYDAHMTLQKYFNTFLEK
jgi:hypothetical protein